MPILKSNKYDEVKRAIARRNQGDPWVMYLIVRQSLNMSAGKVGAQCGHAVGKLDQYFYSLVPKVDKIAGDFGTRLILGTSITKEQQEVMDLFTAFNSWKEDSFRKVVLRAKDSKWERLKEELTCIVVRDAGFTEVPSGSETVIGVWPMLKSNCPKSIQKLQVLK